MSVVQHLARCEKMSYNKCPPKCEVSEEKEMAETICTFGVTKILKSEDLLEKKENTHQYTYNIPEVGIPILGDSKEFSMVY
jgi:hypothetical protein